MLLILQSIQCPPSKCLDQLELAADELFIHMGLSNLQGLIPKKIHLLEVMECEFNMSLPPHLEYGVPMLE